MALVALCLGRRRLGKEPDDHVADATRHLLHDGKLLLRREWDQNVKPLLPAGLHDRLDLEQLGEAPHRERDLDRAFPGRVGRRIQVDDEPIGGLELSDTARESVKGEGRLIGEPREGFSVFNENTSIAIDKPMCIKFVEKK